MMQLIGRTIDEVAAVAGIKAARVRDYFRSTDELRDALADAPVLPGGQTRW